MPRLLVCTYHKVYIEVYSDGSNLDTVIEFFQVHEHKKNGCNVIEPKEWK